MTKRTMTDAIYDAIHLVASSSGTEGWINLYTVTNALLARCERLRCYALDPGPLANVYDGPDDDLVDDLTTEQP
jgi:hypothetical protein